MALEIHPFPALEGDGAEAFVKEMKRVDAGITDREKKEIQDGLRAALRFFGGLSSQATGPSSTQPAR